MWYLAFSFWLTSLSMITSRSIHATADGIISCFLVVYVSVQFSHSVVSNSLWPHGLQHTRTPCPIWNRSVVPCPVLTVASWPTYRSGCRPGGLVFPSLSGFSTVYCDPHSQRLWHSQWSRNRCFSGTLLVFPWSSRCGQFALWFLYLF